jgi:hypothetical protein
VVDPKPDQPGRIIFRSEILEMTDDGNRPAEPCGTGGASGSCTG